MTDYANPGVVFVATRQPRPGDVDVTLELRPTHDGTLVIMAYSSLDTLVAGAGEEQPWIAVPPDQLDELLRRTGAGGVLLDAVIPPGLRHELTGGGTHAGH
jgi:hypothetical protein